MTVTSKQQPAAGFLLKNLVCVLALISLASCSAAQEMGDHHHTASPAASADTSETQDWARQRLAKSPRHQEWIKVKNGTREVNSFVVYPEVKTKATAVVVIHEIFGMSDWVQSLTDQLAEAGYIAIAPDLLSGMGPNGGGTAEVRAVDSNAVGKAINALPPDQITADLNAVADYVSKLPAANGKVVVTGYCWGGSQSFRFATDRPSLKAAFVFYGTAPTTGPQDPALDTAALGKISVPVYGFYGENDARVVTTIPPTVDAMKELNKKFDPVTYAGAGPGFMRAGEPNGPPPAADADQKTKDAYAANRKARDDAWERWKKILAKI